MTDTEQKALALINGVNSDQTCITLASLERNFDSVFKALCRSIEAHEATKAEFEAFRREVSDAVEADTNKQIKHGVAPQFRTHSVRFILLKPVDPLVEVLGPIFANTKAGDSLIETADRLRKDLAARGGRVVFGEE